VIVGQSDPYFSALSSIYTIDDRPITSCDDVWVGASTVIFPGVTIGDQSVITAGAVEAQNVPPTCVVAGVPLEKSKTFRNLTSLKAKIDVNKWK